MKKTVFLTLLAFLLTIPVFAQIDDDFNPGSDFQSFRDSIFKDYESFRRQANEEYANFMKRPWEKEPMKPAATPPDKPKPPVPVVVDPQKRPTADPIPFDGKPRQPKPIDHPQPIEPIKLKPRPTDPSTSIIFFGTPLAFHFDFTKKPTLTDVYERSVSNMWNQLSDAYYDNIIAECLKHRDNYNLCDWAYVLLTKQVAEKCCGSNTNESVVMHLYLLTQSGFNVRIARASNNRLAIMIGSEYNIYRMPYFELNGLKYYLLDRSLNNTQFYIFNQSFPKEKTLSLAVTQPKLNVTTTKERTIASKKYSDVKVTVKTNQNLIDFYNTYPQNGEWHFLSKASLSQTSKDALYPVLREAIKNKSEAHAANILINFVQTGFEYQTDDKQFGYERALFPDESLFYPYCDCEDRSILYSCLIRELLGLDVVLLNYPEHLATAVHFNEDVNGDYLMIDGKKYIICDPTFIGAPIGMCMPDYKKTAPIVQKI